MVKAIIFDFDGTLVDSFPIALKVVNALAKKYGYAELKNVPALRDRNLRDIIKQDFHISLFQLPKYIREAKLSMKEDMKKAKVFPGVRQIIAKLSRQYAIGILTSNMEETVRSALNDSHIDFISSDSSIFGKAAALQRVLKEQGLKKEEIIYVGDETRDVEACKKIGVRCVAVTWGYNSEKILKSFEPDFLARNPAELLGILTALR